MNCVIRLAEKLLAASQLDLRRQHKFAYERVGFLHARVASVGNDVSLNGELEQAVSGVHKRSDQDSRREQKQRRWGWIVLPFAYIPVSDECYIPDDEVGARIDGGAVREQMQGAFTAGVSVVHVHLHEHFGTPRFSPTDMESTPRLLRALHDAAPEIPHAALILSRDSASAVAILPGSGGALTRASVTMLTRSMRFAPSATSYPAEERYYG